MGETAFFQLVEVHLEGDELGGLLDVVEVCDVKATCAVHDGNLFVVEVDDLLGIFNNGGCVGANVEFGAARGFVFANADDKGTALAGADYLVGVAFFEDGNGIGTDDVFQGQLDGGVEVALMGVHHVFNQLDENLGVGFATESHSVFFEFGTERFVVLDDAVVN